MARTVKDYMDFVANVIQNIPNQTEGILKRNEATILDLNRQEQLYKYGEDSKGNLLEEYKPFTIEIKQLLGQPYDRTTLFYSGDFYKSFVMEIDKEKLTLTIYATDRKVPKLIVKYGADIFGLNEEHKSDLNERLLKPELQKYIKQWL